MAVESQAPNSPKRLAGEAAMRAYHGFGELSSRKAKQAVLGRLVSELVPLVSQIGFKPKLPYAFQGKAMSLFASPSDFGPTGICTRASGMAMICGRTPKPGAVLGRYGTVDTLLLEDGQLLEVSYEGRWTRSRGWCKTSVRQLSLNQAVHAWDDLEEIALGIVDLYAPSLAQPVYDHVEAEAGALRAPDPTC